MNDGHETTAVRKKVLVVDDHSVVRMGLSQLINREEDLVVCGEAEDEKTALEAVERLRPDVAVVDWSLKARDASELIMTMRQDHPQLPVLVLSMHDELFYAARALRAGANGYVMKQAATGSVIEAIRRVAAGKSYLSERASHVINGESRKWMQELPGAGADGKPVPRPPPLGADAITVSIVIPVYNAEKTIERLCDQLIRELRPYYRLQIVLVDDASEDHSAEACRRLHERYPEIVDCVVLSRNFGEHNAVMAGLNCAEGDYCVVMDDDFQNPPSEVRTLVEEIKKGHDVVYVRYGSKQHSWFRNLGSRLHNWMAIRALGKPADLYLSSFKALSRFAVQEVVRYTGPAPYLDAIILRSTRRIGVVRARHEPRDHGRSGYTVGKLLSLWGNMIVSFSLYPLRLLVILGVGMTALGVFYGFYTLLVWALPASFPEPDAYQKLNAANWFFRGLVLLAVGIVGEYVGRTYMHLNRDPQFIVRHILRHQPRK